VAPSAKFKTRPASCFSTWTDTSWTMPQWPNCMGSKLWSMYINVLDWETASKALTKTSPFVLHVLIPSYYLSISLQWFNSWSSQVCLIVTSRVLFFIAFPGKVTRTAWKVSGGRKGVVILKQSAVSWSQNVPKGFSCQALAL
jgi:hypothetical protein